MSTVFKKRLYRILPFIAVIVSVILVFFLYRLMSGYNDNIREKSKELYQINADKHEEMDRIDKFGDDELSHEEKELEYKKVNYNFYQKLKEHIPVNVLFVGNGIVEGTGLMEIEQSWVSLLAREIRTDYKTELIGTNFGMANTDMAYGYHVIGAYAADMVSDLVIICYGAGEDPEIFEKYYDGFIRNLKNKNPKCEIYCIIEADPEGEPKNADKVREIATFYDAIAIDVGAYFDSHNLDKEKNLNGLLPDIIGHRAYYECISDVIAKNYAEERVIDGEIRPYLESSTEFDRFRYVSQSEMTEISNGIFEFSSYGKVGTVLIRPVENGGYLRVYVNGKKVMTTDCMPDEAGGFLKLVTFAEDLEGINKIRIEIEAGSHSSLVGVGLRGKN